jgi:UDP-N-acetylmuramoyl-tripeptide--D-alanyl-D-alanine ligase
MRYRVSEIAAMLRTPIGRWQVARGVWFRCWPLVSVLAWLHRRTLARRTCLIAVVGSYGKTTTTRATLVALGLPLDRQNLWNAWSDVAAAVLRIRPWHRHAVVEVGIDGVGQMATYAALLRPDVVVVTSIGTEHGRSLGTIETTRHEKAAMVRALSGSGVAVLNGDDPNVVWMKSQTAARVIMFGQGDSNDVRAAQVSLDWPHGTRFRLETANVTRAMHVPLLGETMLYTILAAIAVAEAAGLAFDAVLPRLARLPPTPGRLEPVALPNGAWLLRDDFKSGLETFGPALTVLAQVPAGRRLAVLGEVTEPPGSQGPIYRDLGERFGRVADSLVIIGNNFQRYAAGARRAGYDEATLHDAGSSVARASALLRERLRPGDVVLIKGRHDQRLERIGLALQGHAVRCNLERCEVKVRSCAQCPMLSMSSLHS